jgi:predicted nuclease of predicted toxin-antitoxin system
VKFLADECCPRQISDALRNQGHDVRCVGDTDRRAPDQQVAEMASAENRIILTADYDFGEMAVRDRIPLPGVIIIAPGREAIAERVARVLDVTSEPGAQFDGRLTIIGMTRVRFRPLGDG